MDANQRLQLTFAQQQQAFANNRQPTVSERLEQLDKFDRLITDNKQAICAAINKDFGNRCAQETTLLEITGLLGAITYTKKRLKRWMKPQKRHVGLLFLGAKNTLIPQPKGVIGIVTPWNYPLFLALGPAISAIAAGNRCIIKMAANSKHLCQLLATLVAEIFESDWLAIIPEVSGSEFSATPWDHLVFTGSADTGKRVMAAAAKNLTPVTLELGGKSPAIICNDFDVEQAAKRLLLSKFLNAGQTCVAPDYLFLPEAKLEAFIEYAKAIMAKRFDSISSDDYTSIIDSDALTRLQDTIQDAKQKGAQLIDLLEPSALKTEQKLMPQLAISVNDEMRLMQEEIFGPILAIKTYQQLTEVTAYINQRPRPLALYIFSNEKKVQQQLIDNTLSGGVSINDCMFHVAQHDLPFGGIGSSGMGHYHAREGFMEFSKLRPIFKQARFSSLLLLAPPYGVLFDKVTSLINKLKL